MKMADSEQYKVVVNNICKNFGTLEVLKDCSFKVRKGEFICVVGPTGCGKTTFLNCLTCLTDLSSGEILVDGAKADPKKHNLSFVFQEPTAFPWLTVRQNLEFFLNVKKWPKDKKAEKVAEIASLMGLEKDMDKYPSQLSVSTEQSQPVTPWLAKKALTLARPSLSAPFMSTPTAPWVWMSKKPGITSSPAASTAWAPAAVSPSPTAVMRPSSTSTSAVCIPSGVQTVPPRINQVVLFIVSSPPF